MNVVSRRALWALAQSLVVASIGVVSGACGHCGIEFQEGPTDTGGPAIDASEPNDGLRFDSAMSRCTAGEAPHPTVQSVLDDALCPVVTIPAGTWQEHLVVRRVVEVAGAGSAATNLDGGNSGRVLEVQLGGELFLHDVSITQGLAEEGAGLNLYGPTQLANVRVHGNVARGPIARGGGIALHDALLTLEGGVVVDFNVAQTAEEGGTLSALGGGLYAEGNSARIQVNAAFEVRENQALATEGAVLSLAVEAVGGGIALRAGAILESLAADVNVVDNRAELTSTTTTASETLARGGGVDCDTATFHVQGGTIQGNTSSSESQAEPKSRALGGGIATSGCSVSLQSMRIENNLAEGSCADCTIETAGGGAYLVSSTTLIAATVVDANHATFAQASGFGIGGSIGGGLYILGGTTLVTASTVSNNEVLGAISDGPALGYGGGVAVDTQSATPTSVEFQASTIGPGNRVETLSGVSSFQLGGGLVLGRFFGEGQGEGGLNLVNCTVSGNTLDSSSGVATLIGAGLAVETNTLTVQARLIHVTMTDNHALTSGGDGGGIGTIATNDERIVLQNTLVYGNTASAADTANCHTPDSAVQLRGRNFIGGRSASECPVTFAVGGAVVPLTDPQFGPLQGNGGATETHAIAKTSNARNRAREADCVDSEGSPLAVDQRGQARSDCDSGAFEVQ